MALCCCIAGGEVVQAESVPQHTVISNHDPEPDPPHPPKPEPVKDPEPVKEEPPAPEADPPKDPPPGEDAKRTSKIEDTAVEEPGIAQGTEYVVEVEKPGTGLGLKLTMGAGIMPAIITDSPASGPAAGKVAKYDRIMDVNGSGGVVEDIAKAIQDSTSLKITCRKPKEFKVFISKSSGQSLGLAFIYVDDQAITQDEFLVIENIVDGQLVAELNKQYADRAIRKNDMLMDVNGVKGCEGMLNEIKGKNNLDLHFYRHYKGNEVQ